MIKGLFFSMLTTNQDFDFISSKVRKSGGNLIFEKVDEKIEQKFRFNLLFELNPSL